jgi:transposase
VLEEAQDSEEVIARVAALDIGKAQLVCCVRVPSPEAPGKRTGGGGDLPDDDQVAAGDGGPAGGVGRDPGGDEATSDNWKAPFYLLEAHGLRSGW